MLSFWNKKKNSDAPRIKRQWKITRKCLSLILECAKSNYPNEFGGLLRIDPQQKDTITEIVILPGTVSGDSHAIFQLHMMPVDYNIIGTVHSHPSPYPIPSDADLQLFGKFGRIHIIAANPFIESSWKAYDYDGNSVEMIIV
jgi:proteasome lid subunit RPN8/RPN11